MAFRGDFYGRILIGWEFGFLWRSTYLGHWTVGRVRGLYQAGKPPYMIMIIAIDDAYTN